MEGAPRLAIKSDRKLFAKSRLQAKKKKNGIVMRSSLVAEEFPASGAACGIHLFVRSCCIIIRYFLLISCANMQPDEVCVCVCVCVVCVPFCCHPFK